MKKLLVIMVLSLCLVIPSKAENSKDFEIAGMSLGDSLLNYFTKEEIKKNSKYLYKNKKYYTFAKRTENNDIYEVIQISIKDNDDKYTIENLSGKILFQNNHAECNKKRSLIVKDITKIFSKNIEIKTDEGYEMPSDKTGKSVNDATFFYFPNGSVASVECTDWAKEMRYKDNLKVRIFSKEYNYWLTDEAFK